MKSLLLFTSLLLCGCAAFEPTRLITTTDKKLNVNFSSIEIDNFAQSKEVEATKAIYYTGWLPIPDNEVTPPFNEAIALKLKNGLIASGKGSALQLAIIESGFYMDTKSTDSIAFIGIAASFRDRNYKCTVTLNIKAKSKSERMTFENVEMSNRVFYDIDNREKFVSVCQDKLTEKVANYLRSVVE